MIKFKELLFLKSLKRVGKATIYNKYWDILNDCENFDDLVSKISKDSKFTKDDIDKAIGNAQKLYDDVNNNKEVQVVTVFDDNYPKKLMIMQNKRPLILYIKGNVDSLSKANIAFIGTRKPSTESETFEKKLVKKIVNDSERVIVSGLALGCDKIAHQVTVDENKATIAILPCGINAITPASNKKLAEDILKTNGGLISEYEPNAKAFKGTYLERDKLVAAFSDAVFVVECGLKSGTMHTVEAAQKYDKKIFTFIPEDIPEGEYEGNLSINDAIQISEGDDFNNNLITSKKTSIQQTFD